MYYNYYFKNESPAIGARILDESKSPFPYDGLVKTITTTDEYGCPTGFKMIAGFESEGKRIEKEINVSSMTPMQVLDNIKIATGNKSDEVVVNSKSDLSILLIKENLDNAVVIFIPDTIKDKNFEVQNFTQVVYKHNPEATNYVIEVPLENIHSLFRLD